MTTRDDYVAGLAEVIAGHNAVFASLNRGQYVCAGCDADLGTVHGKPASTVLAAHQAEWALAHLEAQGWARGREEYSARTAGAGRIHADSLDDARVRARTAEEWGFPSVVESRRVTDWVPVEIGEKE